MKKLLYLFSITIALTAFTSVNAKAQAWSSNQDQNDQGNQDDHSNQGDHDNNQDDNGHGHNHGRGDDGDSSSAQLPINGGVEFLMLAGVIIGIVAVQRYKSIKPATVQE